MGMPAMDYSAFGDIKFSKMGNEIAAKADERVRELKEKIKEREGRIIKIKAESGLDDVNWTKAINQDHATYTSSRPAGPGDAPGGQITAGQVLNVREEFKHIDREQKEIVKLQLLSRNIEQKVAHQLTFSELEYLGF